MQSYEGQGVWTNFSRYQTPSRHGHCPHPLGGRRDRAAPSPRPVPAGAGLSRGRDLERGRRARAAAERPVGADSVLLYVLCIRFREFAA